jgi:uncharacterized protein YcsI (UPF0317 family)
LVNIGLLGGNTAEMNMAAVLGKSLHLTHGAPVHLGDPGKSVSAIWLHRILAIQ